MARTQTKRCSKCHEAKKASAFYKSQWENGSWCKECERLNYANNSDKVRWQRILQAYGLSQADYTTMLERQGGVCAICKNPEKAQRFKFLAVDHDHSTNKIRGLLCHRCNAGLGNFNDVTRLLREAADYLENHSVSELRKDVRSAFVEFNVAQHLAEVAHAL